MSGFIRVPKAALFIGGLAVLALAFQLSVVTGGVMFAKSRPAECGVDNPGACAMDRSSQPYQIGYQVGSQAGGLGNTAEEVKEACAAAAEQVYGLTEKGMNAFTGCVDGWLDSQP